MIDRDHNIQFVDVATGMHDASLDMVNTGGCCIPVVCLEGTDGCIKYVRTDLWDDYKVRGEAALYE